MIITKTPLRICFFGGGTDFPEFYKRYGGAIFTTTINKYIYVIVRPKLSLEKTPKNKIVSECMKYLEITDDIEVVIMSDIPFGTGLGSSSALTVGVLKALYAYKGIEKSNQEIADEACDIEINKLKSPIGIQDQYAISYGGSNIFEFEAGGVAFRKIDLSSIANNLMLFYTGITRSSNKILKVQSKNTQENTKVLLKMKELVYKAEKSTKDFGKMLDETWNLKKKLANSISTPQIDKWYNRAKKAGATGGKILGAGGGGFLLIYCPEEKKNNIRGELGELIEMDFDLELNGSKVILNI